MRLEGLLLALVTDLPRLLLAVLGVAVLLGLLGASLHLQFADLLGLEVAILLPHGEWENVGELLAIPVDISLAHLHLDLSRDVITIMFILPVTDDTLGSIAIILGALVPLAVKHHGVGAGHIVDNLLFHVAVRSLKVGALVVVLGGHVDLVGGVTNSILASETPLDLVSFFQSLVVNGLNQVANKFVHIEANSLHTGLDNTGAVLVQLWRTFFFILSPACFLLVRLALVLEHHLLYHVAVGVLVDTIASHVVLPDIRVVSLNRSRGGVFRMRGWSTGDKG